MITVVVPTYNRGDILRRTIPQYLDPNVSSVLVVDDGSSDDTAQVIAALRQGDPRIQYLKNESRQGSVVARNKGLRAVGTPYFLMTDDDVYPDSGFFAAVLAAAVERDADIVAVRKVRLNERGDEQLARQSGGQGPPADYDRLAFDFDTQWAGPTTTVPGTYFAKQALAAATYDTKYQGSAWREETDFGLTAHLNGFSIYFEPKALVFELPKSDHHGGQWARPLSVYIASAIRNNWYFLKKFQAPLRRANLLHRPIWRLHCRFIVERLTLLVIVPAKQILGPRAVMFARRLLGRA